MNRISQYIKAQPPRSGGLLKVPRLECADGWNVSVQAGWHAYCTPRDNDGPWTEFEAGFPSAEEADLMQYAEDADIPTKTVYGWVPVDLIESVIAKHGGCAQLDTFGESSCKPPR